MYKYENNSNDCGEACAMPVERLTLTENMCTARNLGDEALHLAEMIRGHFLGDYMKKEGLQKNEPTCFAAAMEVHCKDLQELCDTLRVLISSLGCKER